MAALSACILLSLDGCCGDANSEMNWATLDPEPADFAANKASGRSRLVFGPITYDMMKPFWTSP